MSIKRNELLKKLEEMLKSGDATASHKAGPGTMICVTQKTPFGVVYAQEEWEKMTSHMQALFLGRVKGDIVSEMKLVGVFDLWEKTQIKAPPVKVLYS